jgi:hypothetical protein
MQVKAWACVAVAAASIGCQTITEELPTQASGVGSPFVGQPAPNPVVRAIPIAGPSAAPTAAPATPPPPIVITVPLPTPATPAPAATPTPAPAATPTPAPPAPTPTPAPAATPTPAPTPAPTPTPAPDKGSIDDIRVGFFGISCGKNSTREIPGNGKKLLPLGCRGFVTATPKRKDNTDVPAKEHGPDISWELKYGDNIVDLQAPTFASDFNKDLVGKRVGPFSLCATVKGVTGCLNGDVIP